MRPAFDRASRPLYLVAGGIMATTVVLFLALGFSTDPYFILFFACAIWPWLGGILAKRVGHPRLGAAAEMVGLIYMISLTVIFTTMALTAISLPFADPALAAADRAIGFDWESMANALAPHRAVISALTSIYRSVGWQPAAAIALLCIAGCEQRAQTFVLAWAVALALSSASYPFFIAEGPFAFYRVTPAQFPNALSNDPWLFGPLISSIRDDGLRYISSDMLTGLITFPSFHAAAAVLLTWACLPLRWFRVPTILLNIAMMASVMIIGAHYLVDLIAGISVAAVAIWLAKTMIDRKAES